MQLYFTLTLLTILPTQRPGRYDFNLCNLSNVDNMDDATRIVTKRICSIAETITRTNRKPLIGIGYAQVDKHTDSEELDPMEQTTFNMEGIHKKWEIHRTRGYSMDGMSVVTVVTKDVASRLGFFEDVEVCVKELQANTSTKLKDSNRLLGTFKSKEKGSSVATCLYITVSYLQN